MDAFIGEVRIFAGSFAPTGWAFCDGQLLPISQHQALFSILGSTYGGDGVSSFALPDLRDAAPLMAGQGPGLSPRALGASGGAQAVTLSAEQMPAHGHTLNASQGFPDANAPASGANGTLWGSFGGTRRRSEAYYSSGASQTQPMGDAMIAAAGGDQPHNNLPPYLTLSFIIALEGIFPTQA